MPLQFTCASWIFRIKILKNISLIISFMLLAFTGKANNYYISSSTGNDGFSSSQAQNQATPWQSINKLNSFFNNLKAGDNIYFKRGDTFYGSIVVTKSGTSGNPIVISAYGSGNNPVITGLASLSSWNSIGNGIFVAAAFGTKSTVNLVTINGKPQQIGRYPNADAANGGYLTYESYSGKTSIYDNQLSGSPNWTGAEVVIRKQHYLLERCLITNHSGSSINYVSTTPINPANGPAVIEVGTNGFGYFIQRDPRTLDQFGEWYFDPNSNNMQMYFGGNNPSSYNIQVSNVDTLVNINNNYFISISNLSLEGANMAAVYAKDGGNITVQNCNINSTGAKGIYFFNCPNTLVDNINSNYALSNGIDITNRQAQNVTITNSNITNTGIYAGLGSNWNSADYKGIFVEVSDNALLQYNNVINTGYTGIHWQGNDVTVKNNFVNNYNYVTEDGGGIYTYTTNSEFFTNRVVRDNIVLNGIGAPAGTAGDVNVQGIYLDGSTMNVDVLNNSVANVASNGFYTNNPTNVKIDGNTSFNNGSAIGLTKYYDGPVISNFSITNNVLYPKYPNQNNLLYVNTGLDVPYSMSIETAMQQIGTIENNYLNLPNAAGFGYYFKNNAGGDYTFPAPITFNGWKAASGHDLASKLPPIAIPTYKLNSLTGANQIVNGQFNNDISSTNFFADNGNNTSSWDNTGKLGTGGSLKITPSGYASNFTYVYKTAGAVSVNKNYILRFSTVGSGNNGLVNVLIRQTNGSYSTISNILSQSYGTSKQDHEFMLTATASEGDATLLLEVQQTSGVTYIDDIQFYEADVSPLDLNTQLRFEYNASKNITSIPLGGNYVGVDGTQYNGSVSLQPYTSKILILSGAATALPLTATASAGPVSCFGGTVNVVVAATGGSAPYTGTGNFSMGAGPHTFIVKDATGTTASAFLNITQPAAALQAQSSGGAVATFGGTTNVTVTAKGGVAPYKGTGNYSDITAGDYNYMVTDANGCTAITSITISQPGTPIIAPPVTSPTVTNPSIALTASANAGPVYCFGGTVNVLVDATGGTAPYSGTGNFSVGVGSHTFTVTDATGTISSAYILITQPSAVLQAQSSAGAILTAGGTTSVVVTASGGVAPYKGTGNFYNVNAGTYNYTVTDANGCTTLTNITINDPGTLGNLIGNTTSSSSNSSLTSSAFATPIRCFGDYSYITVSGNGGTPPYNTVGTYQCSAGIGSLKISFPTAMKNNFSSLYSLVGSLNSSKYYVVRFTTLGTTEQGFLRVYLGNAVAPYNLLGSQLPSASFGITRIDHQFIFSIPESATNAKFIIEVDQNSGTTYIDNLAFFESSATGNLIGANVLSGGQFESNINTMKVWSLNNNEHIDWDNTAKINNTYYYTTYDATGLTSTSVINLSQPAPLQLISSADPINSTTGFTTIGVLANGGTPPYIGTGYFYVTAGTYTYTVTDANGCTASTTYSTNQSAARIAAPTSNALNSQLRATSINSSNLSVTTFPNPTTSEFGLMVQGGSNEAIEITVSSSDGKVLLKRKGYSNQKYNFGNDFFPGMYFVQVIQGKTVKTVKALKTRP